jgi:hypothetical protein
MNNESPAALLPESVNNALTNLREIAAARDTVSGDVLTRYAMSRLAADAIRALESTAPAASESRGSVPDGWVLVPREPTPEMCDAPIKNDRKGWRHVRQRAHFSIWTAMVSAAPTPPAVSNGEPTAEQWKEAAKKIVQFFIGRTLLSAELAKMESHARELARSAAAKGGG